MSGSAHSKSPVGLQTRPARLRDAANLRPLRFHDLRHTFGSLAINKASIVQVQHWMGHSRSSTTERYLHYKSRADEAERAPARQGELTSAPVA